MQFFCERSRTVARRYPSLLTTLAPPWSRVAQADEVALEVKMQGDRASLRRRARQVQRREAPGDRFDGESSTEGRPFRP